MIRDRNKNQPYKKEYVNGVLINPIKGNYSSPHPNRAQRRLSEKAMIGKNFMSGVQEQVVTASPARGVFMKYKKYRQIIIDKFGNKKTINHTVAQ